MTESQHTEWKTSWRDEYLRWVCGFANADGGTLVVGRMPVELLAETDDVLLDKLRLVEK